VETVIERVEQSRRKAAIFLKSMEVEPGIFTNSSYNKPVHTPGMRLPATYNAVSCLRLIGAELPDAQRFVSFLNGFQTGNGAYRIPEMKAEDLYYPDFEYDDFHITNYILSALDGVGRPEKPFSFLADYDTPEKLDAWLARRDMARPWTEGNYIVNLASFFDYTGRDDLFEQVFQWHLNNQDEHGYWHDPSTDDLTSAMAGAAHNLHLFYKLNRPVPRYRRIIDHCLSIPNEVSTACIDVDIADILAHFTAFGYRTNEIKMYLAVKLDSLLGIQQDDGGFYDTTIGTRVFDGWSVYQEPQGLSNCFATWFRMIAIGLCTEALYPGAFEWTFRTTIGIGYYNRDYLRGGFTEPVEAPARRYGLESADTTTAQCSDALMAVIEETGKRFEHARSDFVCVFEITGDGVFTLDLRNGSVRPADEGGDLRVTLTLKTLSGLLSGKINPTAAYALRKLKLKGDISKALKLVGLLGS
jgi:putative sterol carrier protein